MIDRVLVIISLTGAKGEEIYVHPTVELYLSFLLWLDVIPRLLRREPLPGTSGILSGCNTASPESLRWVCGAKR